MLLQGRCMSHVCSDVLSTRVAALQVRSHFRPEFINRIDEFTVFKALQRKDIKRIVILQAKRVEERLQAKKMKMKLLEPAIEFLAVCFVTSILCLFGGSFDSSSAQVSLGCTPALGQPIVHHPM